MANCNNLFEDFNRTIRLDSDKRIALRERRDNLRSRIDIGFRELQEIRFLSESLNPTIDEDIEFQSQGSFVMDTIINPCRSDDEYDIDDGVYFIGKRKAYQRPSEQEFHNFIVESIKRGHQNKGFERIDDRATCVRVGYRGENGDFNYHVDLPIYYANDVYEPELADTAKGWYVSNPIAFIVWFEEKIQSGFEAKFILESKLYNDEYENWLNDRRKKDHQLRRIVRYLKAWGDFIKEDMPPGVVMTILAGENYVESERDDVSLRDTLIAIKEWLIENDWKCPRPSTPKGDDLFKGYSLDKMNNFKNALNNFIDDAKQAIQNPSKKDSCELWQRNFGSRFSCENVKNEKDYSALSAAAVKSDLWCS